MDTFPFDMREHVIPCQKTSSYSWTTSTKRGEAHCLVAKQYIPRDSPGPRVGDVTIIGAHAHSFPTVSTTFINSPPVSLTVRKELYEPLWAEIHNQARSTNVSIRSIWIVDSAKQRSNGIPNKTDFGNDATFSASEHAHTLLHMIHAFRDEIVQPIIGIGHGMGAISLVSLAILHPPLLQTLILIDPTIHDRRMLTVDADAGNKKPDPTPISVNPSARRCCPRSTAAAATDGPIKKHEDGSRGRRRAHGLLKPYIDHTLNTSASTTAAAATIPPFPSPARSQHHLNTDLSLMLTFDLLPSLRPSVLYIFGNAQLHPQTTTSTSTSDTWCNRKAEQDAIVNGTGVGRGGSGGLVTGRVVSATIGLGVQVEGQGAAAAAGVVVERVGKVGGLCVGWMGREVMRRKGDSGGGGGGGRGLLGFCSGRWLGKKSVLGW
ncbi:hypothetical protein BK809_0000285 [Diplodia seriata]|uniref:AB hydrolase-1 domain-containing protein n=1 Tax=Diplodia seriata TaxID=420778 RepID=A0A1S8BCK8_9PEZI|nr:hypothetical protein BK809_0000285 [Diplodia seriata]